MLWEERGPDRLRFTERDFKVCDLCGALNPVTNPSCFVCGWSGRFHDDAETVREAMRTVESEHGGLDRSLFAEEVVPSTPPKMGFWTGAWGSFKRLFSRE
jgi:hypothetical protein